MKKLWMLLMVLALLATAAPMFASDVTFSGRMIWSANYDPDFGAGAGLVRFRPTLTAKIDDFNTLVAGFRAEGWNVVDPTMTDIWTGLRVRDLYLTTDVTGALGLDLPITIKTTIGQWEPGFTDWAYASESGWENYYDWPNKIADVGPFDKQMTAQVDIGFGPAALHVYSDFLGFMMLGLSGGFGPVSGWLTYQAPASGFGDGILGVEAKYAGEFGDLKVGVPVFFRYELADPPSDGYQFTYGVGASVDYTMFHVAAGVEGDDVDALDNVVIDVGVKPLENLQLKVNTYLDLAATDALSGIDIQVNYMLGGTKLMLGYVVAGEVTTDAIPINGDTFGVANGLYMAVDVSF